MRAMTMIGLILLCGCATTYRKPGATNQDFHKDKINCLTKAGQAGYAGGDFSSNLKRDDFIEECLTGEGWERVKK